MNIIEALTQPDVRRLVGVEDHPGGGIRCYVSDRALDVHVHVDQPDDVARVRAAWSNSGGTGPFIPAPEAYLCCCGEPTPQETSDALA